MPTSTSIYGINAGTYSAWAGNQYNAGTGVLSPLDLFTASATAAGRGLMGEAMCFLPPKTWHNVMNAMTGLQRYDYSYDTKKADYGVAAISLITNVGKMTIYSHPLMKDGHAFILPKEGVSRIGATDIVFGDPSYPDRFIFPIPGFNASEIRAYFYHGVFIEKPSHGVYVYGFTNS